MTTGAANDRPFRREERKSHSDRPGSDDRVEPRDPPERDLFDSPSDSWRDLELREMLDQIENQPVERAGS